MKNIYESLKGNVRRRDLVAIRMLCVYKLRNQKITYNALASIFVRNHSTMIHYYKKTIDLLSVNDKYILQFEQQSEEICNYITDNVLPKMSTGEKYANNYLIKNDIHTNKKFIKTYLTIGYEQGFIDGQTINLFDPETEFPNPSDEDSEFSDDVFIIDENKMHGLAYYSFMDNKWKFHTDTLVDYNEPGNKTQWKWYYPPVNTI